MKKLLIGLTLLVSMSAFAGVRNICGDAKKNKFEANASLNESLAQPQYVNATAKTNTVSFIEQEKEKVLDDRIGTYSDGTQFQVQGSHGTDSTETIYFACILLENV